jgi:hypothetical protein
MGWTISSMSNVVGLLPQTEGRFFDSQITTSLSTFAMVANTLYGVPHSVPTTALHSNIGVEIQTASAAGKLIRLGIYRDNSGVPGSLFIDAGSVLADTSGAKLMSVGLYVPAGRYWLAVVSDGTPTLRAMTNYYPHLGFTSNTDTTFYSSWSVAFTFAALPDPFTGGGALASIAQPRLFLTH